MGEGLHSRGYKRWGGGTFGNYKFILSGLWVRLEFKGTL